MNVLLDRSDALRENLKDLQIKQREAESNVQEELQLKSIETLAELSKIKKLIQRFATELSRVIIR